MSSTLNTYTTNWFKVRHPFMVEEWIELLNKTAESIGGDETFTLHHYKGQMRITGYDLIDQDFGYYEDEEQEEWIDLEEEIANMLVEGEIFRFTSISWFKGRLESMWITAHTWDKKRTSRDLGQVMKAMGEELEIDPKRLKGWN